MSLCDGFLLDSSNLEDKTKKNPKMFHLRLPGDLFIFPGENSPHDSLELLANRAVDEEVDGGVDAEKEVVGAGQAQVPGGAD